MKNPRPQYKVHGNSEIKGISATVIFTLLDYLLTEFDGFVGRDPEGFRKTNIN